MYTHGLLKALVFTLPGTMEFLEKNGFAGMAGDPRIYPRIGLRRVPDGASAEPGGGGGTHPGDDRCIDGALAARMDVRLAGRAPGGNRISYRHPTQHFSPPSLARFSLNPPLLTDSPHFTAHS